MNELISQIEENITGIWENQQYELALSMAPHYRFSFIDKTKSAPEISGKYVIVPDIKTHYPTLRLHRDYIVTELSAFGNLTIVNDEEEIRMTYKELE